MELDWTTSNISYPNSGYTIGDDMVNCKKINEYVIKMAPEYLEDEIKQFKKIQNKLKYGNDLTEKDRDFFKLFYETLENLYSNIGEIIKIVEEVSNGKHI